MSGKSLVTFGSIFSESGELLMIRERSGMVKALERIFEQQIQVKGLPITPGVKKVIKQKAKERWKAMNVKLSSEGLPDYFIELFKIQKKSDVGKFTKNLTIKKKELVRLINNSGQIGYSHRMRFKEFNPKHLNLGDKDFLAISEAKVGVPDKKIERLTNKLSATFGERRIHTCHLFERKNWWHCFYFSLDDMKAGDDSHWRFGSHVHYISHLWSNINKNALWNSFEKREIKFNSSLHIKYEEDSAIDVQHL